MKSWKSFIEYEVEYIGMVGTGKAEFLAVGEEYKAIFSHSRGSKERTFRSSVFSGDETLFFSRQWRLTLGQNSSSSNKGVCVQPKIIDTIQEWKPGHSTTETSPQ